MPYAEIDEAGSKIEITTTYADRYLIKQLPGASYRGETQTWRVPLSWSACITLRGLFGWDLEVGPLLESWARGEHALRIAPALLLRDKLAFDQESLADASIAAVAALLNEIEREAPEDRKLFPYQRIDVTYLALVRDGILANPMGLGKSASAIRTLQVLQCMLGDYPFPVLVICPNTVKETWAGEIEKFAPKISHAVVTGSAGQRRKAIERGADITIVNWESLRIHSRLAPYGNQALTDTEKQPKELNKQQYKTVICDEAHHMKDPHSKQARAAWALMHDAEYRYLMTGTPVVSNVGDLWSLLHAADPRGFPAKTKYLDRWARVELSFYGGAEILGLKPETAAEFRKVTDYLIRRVPKEAALPQLPEKLPVTYRYTEMSPVQAKLYKEMERNEIALVESATEGAELLSAPNAIAQLTRLLQFAAASATQEASGKKKCADCKKVYAEVYDACPECAATGWEPHLVVRLQMPSSKVDDLVELLSEMGTEPLVVAAVHTQLLNLAAARLERAGIKHGLITGEQDTDQRKEAIRLFQEGSIRVILLNVAAGGEGITLTKASTLLFMQRHWSKVVNDQVEDRLHRIGQHYPVQVIDQIAPGTAEYRKLQVIQEKGDRIEEIIRDKEALLRLLGA